MANQPDARAEKRPPAAGQRREGGERDRKGGKGRPGREEAPRAPLRTEDRSVVVDRLNGARILKVSKIDLDARREVSVKYLVEFEGHEAISFNQMGPARDRAKEGPPVMEAPAAEENAPFDITEA